MARRDRRDIVMEILTLCSMGKAKTHIMYRVGLSFRQCNAYVNLLKDSGFLENQGRLYFTTADGKKVLEGCRICHDLTSKLWKSLEEDRKPGRLNVRGVTSIKAAKTDV